MLSERELRTSIPGCSPQHTRRANGASPRSLISPSDRAAAPDFARVPMSGMYISGAGTSITAATHVHCGSDASRKFKIVARAGDERLNVSPLCRWMATRPIVSGRNGTLRCPS